MKKLICASAVLSLFACARPTMEPRSADLSTDAPAPAARAASDDAADQETSATVTDAAARAALAAGDFVVFKFTGSFRKEPVTLTQRVVAREGAFLIVDMTLTDGDKSETLRVHMRGASTRGDVAKVERIDNGVAKPADAAAYEAMIAKTLLAADQNEAVVGSNDVEVDVAGSALKCRETTFRVRLGKKQATMKTLESDTFAWGDVGAEIATADGKLLYKAEVIEIGSATPAPMAATDEE
jgi:hypothetical protein